LLGGESFQGSLLAWTYRAHRSVVVTFLRGNLKFEGVIRTTL
jgi:hypothetical protein